MFYLEISIRRGLFPSEGKHLCDAMKTGLLLAVEIYPKLFNNFSKKFSIEK